MDKVTLFASDLGRGRCKHIALVDGKARRRQHDTLLGQQSTGTFRGVLGAGVALNGTSVTVQHPALGVQVREVGGDARAHSEATWAPRHREQSEEDLVALLAYGLKVLGVGGDVHLAVGTPARFYDVQRANLEVLFSGTWTVNGRQVSIVKTSVLPQPAGTAWHLVADYKTGQARQNADVYLKGKIAIVDVGEYSTDGGMMERMHWRSNRTVTMEVGVGKLKEAVADYLTDTGYPKRPHEVDVCLRERQLNLSTGPVILDGAIDRAVEYHGRAIVEELAGEWPDLLECDRIVVTGGGAYYFGRLLSQAWGSRVVLMSEGPDPQDGAEWANVQGYMALLHWSYRRK